MASIETGIKGTGFAAADTEVKHRIVMSIQGREKCGKSHLALTAPGPVGIISLDIGLEGVISKFTDKQMFVSEYRVPSAMGGDTKVIAAESDKVWTGLVRDFRAALKTFRTVVIDTATEMWELLRMARFGKLSQVLPHHYAPVNTEYRELLREAYDSNCNLILVHKMKPEWLNDASGKGSKTGRFERAGFGDTGFLVQVNVECSREGLDKRESDYDDGFRITVLDCRQNPDLAGQAFQNPLNTFPMIASMIFPTTSPEDWE